MRSRRLALLLTIVISLFLTSEVFAAKRVALVIGIGNYLHVGQLKNPVNDAHTTALTLAEAGFEVTERVNPDKEALDKIVRDFAETARNAAVAVIYYSGHGIPVGPNNYMIPIDAPPTMTADNIEDHAVTANKLVRRVSDAGTPLILMFLDACRLAPFSMGNKSLVVGGLAAMAAPPRPPVGVVPDKDTAVGTIIGFSTQPGELAVDGNSDTSPYASALATYINKEKPGLEVRSLLDEVAREVSSKTKNKQRPWFSHSGIDGKFYFFVLKEEPRPMPIAPEPLISAPATPKPPAPGDQTASLTPPASSLPVAPSTLPTAPQAAPPPATAPQAAPVPQAPTQQALTAPEPKPQPQTGLALNLLADAREYLSERYTQKDKFIKAREKIQEALRADPGLSKAHSHLGFTYYQEGQAIKKLAEHSSSRQEQLKYTEAAWQLYRTAVPYFGAAFKLDNHNAAAYRQRGATILAAYRARKILNWDPGDQLKVAISDLKNAVTLDPRSAGNAYALGEAYNLSGDYLEAIKWFDKANEINMQKEQKGYASAYSGSCFAKRMLKRDEEAKRDAIKAAKLADSLRTQPCMKATAAWLR